MPHARPRRRFGQNFLRDQSVIDRLIAAIAPTPNDHLVEIGPGKGALTQPLAAACGKLDAIEIDRDLVVHLQQALADCEKLQIHELDALALRLDNLGKGQLRLVGNLPYNISTPLLFHLLAQRHQICDMHFMLQKEVVQRICATPGSKAYGRLSVSMQLRCEAQALFEIGPEAFYPPPKVYSQIVRIRPFAHDPLEGAAGDVVDDLVKAAFSQRRKTLRNSLKRWLDPNQIADAGVDPAARPETLLPTQFVALAEQMCGS